MSMDERRSHTTHDVFISYAIEDKPIADAVVATLESHRIRCWIAPRDVLPGLSWAGAIVDAINDSRLLLLVYSSRSNQSKQVAREVERAANKGIPILPFRTEDVPFSKDMEYFISTLHWLDAITPPLERHLQHLAETVSLILARASGPQEPGQGQNGQPITTPSRPVPAERQRRWPKIHVRVGVLAILLVAVLAVAVIFVVHEAQRSGEAARQPSPAPAPSAIQPSPTPTP